MSNGDLANLFGNAEGFDPMSVDPQADYPVIPPHDYPIEIQGATMVPTKSGTGNFLELKCIVLAPPEGEARLDSVTGFKIVDRLNLDNPSQVASDIAVRSLSALCRALGIQRIESSQQLVGGRCLACVKVKDGSNEIRTYKPLSMASVAIATSPVAPVAPPAPLPPNRQKTYQPNFRQPVGPPSPQAQEMQAGQQAASQPVNPVGGPVAVAPAPAAPPAPVPVQAAAPGQPVAPAPAGELPRPWQGGMVRHDDIPF